MVRTQKLFGKTEWLLVAAYSVLGWAMLATGPGKTLDSRFFYTAEAARSYLEALTPDDVAAYIRVEVIDYFLLASYTALLVRMLGRWFNRHPARWLGLVPGTLDLFETTAILRALQRGDADLPEFLGIVSCAKWSSAYAVLGAIAVKAAISYWKDWKATR